MCAVRNVPLPASKCSQMTTERRYAILIGINDYPSEPLTCCAADAEAVAELLKQKCGFKDSDVKLIVSKTGDTKTEIFGLFEGALKEIGKTFRSEEESIFFFFAGHGINYRGKSHIKFHTLKVSIEEIFGKINAMNPKYQIHLFDACESGGKVLTRGRSSRKLLQSYIKASSGSMLMYASTNTELANESPDLGHGIFTYYFLEALNTPDNYKDGILTLNGICDHMSKKVTAETAFEQTPVVELHSIGYYPFAFMGKSVSSPPVSATSPTARGLDQPSEEIVPSFPKIPSQDRTRVFEDVGRWWAENSSVIVEGFKNSSFELSEAIAFDALEGDLYDSALKAVVVQSEKRKVEAAGEIFSKRQVKMDQSFNWMFGSITAALLRSKQPEYETQYDIDWSASSVMGASLLLKSHDISVPSGAFAFVAYHAKWGMGLATLVFRTIWDGYRDTFHKHPILQIRGYKIDKETASKMIDDIKLGYSDFRKDLLERATERQKEIQEAANTYS
jgi:hypothetical protein